ncbi:MAG TPA: hypothetical protein VK824_02190 [Planctomycetota bacterium]|nr:hypothetical protein [Planctomycetota bacterium]
MPMDNEEHRPRTPLPAQRPEAASGETTSTNASVVATWRQIDLALSPILGSRGTAGLYQRSLHLASTSHPWLAAPSDTLGGSLDTSALLAALGRQSRAEAAAGCATLHRTFHDLLTSLVGGSLTEQLLRHVWDSSSSGPPAPDTTP